MPKPVWIGLGVGGVVAVLAGAAWWRYDQARPAAGVHEVSVQDTSLLLAARSRGRVLAPLTIYEFSDFQCPYCRKFWEETLPAIEREYVLTGKARLIFLNYPIPALHPNALAAHHFAMCAARQDRFWPVHDLLFRHQSSWEKRADPGAYFRTLADSAGMDRVALSQCVERKTVEWLVEADSRTAIESGITGTPAFVINGGLLPGAEPIETWRPILDSIYRVSMKAAGGREN